MFHRARKISGVEWSYDGKHFAFLNGTANHVELWIGDAATGKIRNLKGITINSVMPAALTWMPDNRTLLVQLVPASRGQAPAMSPVPTEPNTQESSGTAWTENIRRPAEESL